MGISVKFGFMHKYLQSLSWMNVVAKLQMCHYALGLFLAVKELKQEGFMATHDTDFPFLGSD